MDYGADLGARRIAVACPDTMHFAELTLPKLKVREREDVDYALHALGWWIHQTVPADATLWVEAPILGESGNASTVIRIAMTAGAIMAAHPGPSHLVAPSRWKAKVLGYGSADKADVAAWLAYTCPAVAAACGTSQDLRDASCLALGGPELAPDEQLRRPRAKRVLRPQRNQTDEPRRARRRKKDVPLVPRQAGLFDGSTPD